MRRSPDGEWYFEAGSFCDHWLCTLRVRAALEQLGKVAPGSHEEEGMVSSLDEAPG
jgi:hypothetical protein